MNKNQVEKNAERKARKAQREKDLKKTDAEWYEEWKSMDCPCHFAVWLAQVKPTK
jgi:hypothetical protein